MQLKFLLHCFRKELEAWELKMISIGRVDLVRAKPTKEKKPLVAKKQQQEIGCSDDFSDSSTQLSDKDDVYNVQSISKEHTSTSREVPQMSNINEVTSISDKCPESVSCQSTGATSEIKTIQSNRIEPSKPNDDKETQSKTIIGSIKKFFKF